MKKDKPYVQKVHNSKLYLYGILVVLALMIIAMCNNNHLFAQRKYKNFPNLFKNKTPVRSEIKNWVTKGDDSVLQIEDRIYSDSIGSQKLRICDTVERCTVKYFDGYCHAYNHDTYFIKTFLDSNKRRILFKETIELRLDEFKKQVTDYCVAGLYNSSKKIFTFVRFQQTHIVKDFSVIFYIKSLSLGVKIFWSIIIICTLAIFVGQYYRERNKT